MKPPKSRSGYNRRSYYQGVHNAIVDYEKTLEISLKHLTTITPDSEDELHWFDSDPDEDIERLTSKLELDTQHDS